MKATPEYLAEQKKWYEQRMAELNVPRAYWDKSFTNYTATTPAQAAAKDAAEDFPYYGTEAESAAHDYGHQHLNMVLAGPCGTGKTHLACGVLRSEDDTYGNVEFISAVELVRKFRDKPASEEQLMRHYGNSQYDKNEAGSSTLFIDDLGADADRYAAQVICEILDRRVGNDAATVITTNATKSEMRELLGERGFSRLMYRCKWVAVLGDDYRMGVTQ